MRASVLGAVAWLLLGCFALVPVVRADAPSDDVSKLIEEGLQLRTEGRDADALQRFEAAYLKRKEPRTLVQIALAEQALGRWIPAHAHLSEALSQRGDAWIDQRRAQLDGSLKRIESEFGTLEIVSSVPGSVVSLGGREFGTTPFPQPIRALPGTIAVRVQAPGHLPFEQTVEVARGKLARVVATLRAEPPPQPTVAVAPAAPEASQASAQTSADAPEPRVSTAELTHATDAEPIVHDTDPPAWGRRSVLLGVAGAGVASTLAAAAAYAVAGKKTKTLKTDCYDGAWCEDEEREERRGEVKTLERASRALLGVGIVMLAGSGITYLIARKMTNAASDMAGTRRAPLSLGASFDRSGASVLGTMEF